MLNGLSPRDRVEANEDWVVVIDSEKIKTCSVWYMRKGSWDSKKVYLDAVAYGTSAPFLFGNTLGIRQVYDFSTNLGKINNNYPHKRFTFNSDRRDTLLTTDGIYFIGISNSMVIEYDKGEPDINNNSPPELDLLKVTLDRSAKGGGYFKKISPDNLDNSSEISQLYSQVNSNLKSIHSEALEYLRDIDCSLREVTYTVNLHYGDCTEIRGSIRNQGEQKNITHPISATKIHGDVYHRWFQDKFVRVLNETVGKTGKVDFITSSGIVDQRSRDLGYHTDYFVIKSSDIELLSDQRNEFAKYLPQLTDTLNRYLPGVSVIPAQKQPLTNSQNHSNQHAQSTGHAPNQGLADMQLVDVLHSISFELSRIADSLENSKR